MCDALLTEIEQLHDELRQANGALRMRRDAKLDILDLLDDVINHMVLPEEEAIRNKAIELRERKWE